MLQGNWFIRWALPNLHAIDYLLPGEGMGTNQTSSDLGYKPPRSSSTKANLATAFFLSDGFLDQSRLLWPLCRMTIPTHGHCSPTHRRCQHANSCDWLSSVGPKAACNNYLSAHRL